ncbi:MAG: carotenoid biosynthesis protein [Fimbriimonas sp.]
MHEKVSVVTKVYLGLVAFSIAGSALTRATSLDPGLIRPVASVLLLVTGALALMKPMAASVGPGRAGWAVTCVLLVGLLAEVCGIYTGYPFGPYAYTAVWQPVVTLPGEHFFPIPVCLAWFLVAGGSYFLAARLFAGFWAIPLGAVLATLIDLAMEPVMVNQLGYWKWLEPTALPGGAAWLNPFGWLLTSWIAGAILHRFGAERTRDSDDSAWVVGGFIVLVGAFALIQG